MVMTAMEGFMDYVSTNPVVALAAGTVIVAAVFVAGQLSKPSQDDVVTRSSAAHKQTPAKPPRSSPKAAPAHTQQQQPAKKATSYAAVASSAPAVAPAKPVAAPAKAAPVSNAAANKPRKAVVVASASDADEEDYMGSFVGVGKGGKPVRSNAAPASTAGPQQASAAVTGSKVKAPSTVGSTSTTSFSANGEDDGWVTVQPKRKNKADVDEE